MIKEIKLPPFPEGKHPHRWEDEEVMEYAYLCSKKIRQVTLMKVSDMIKQELFDSTLRRNLLQKIQDML